MLVLFPFISTNISQQLKYINGHEVNISKQKINVEEGHINAKYNDNIKQNDERKHLT